MPVPRIYMIQEYSPNAFALGLSRQGSVIAVTEGLLRILTNEEIEAVVCLCLAQLRLKEYRRSPLASFLALPFFLLARRLPVVFSQILRSFGSLIIWIFVRPERIFLGDAYAAQVFQKPSAIARALRKMTSLCRMVPLTQQNLALDHLFLISTYKEEDWVGRLQYPSCFRGANSASAGPFSDLLILCNLDTSYRYGNGFFHICNVLSFRLDDGFRACAGAQIQGSGRWTSIGPAKISISWK